MGVISGHGALLEQVSAVAQRVLAVVQHLAVVESAAPVTLVAVLVLLVVQEPSTLDAMVQ